MLNICSISESQIPRLFESYDCIGTLKPEMAAQLGLPAAVKVAAGAGDNAAAAIGTGVIGEGGCNISVGTSGTVFISSEKFSVDSNNGLHSFAHADGGYHLMACMLSAASCNKWLMDDILKATDYAAEQAAILPEKLGENHVFFLPYLMGERSPINDTDARGTFIGMTMDSSRADLVQAVLEGVAFAIRDCVEVAKDLGIQIQSSKICGGGSKSDLWKKIIANVLNISLEVPETEQGPGVGGIVLAMVASGACADVAEGCAKFTSVSKVIRPEPALVEKYEKRYRQFKAIYPACKELFTNLTT